jgi:hypothetical protein
MVVESIAFLKKLINVLETQRTEVVYLPWGGKLGKMRLDKLGDVVTPTKLDM